MFFALSMARSSSVGEARSSSRSCAASRTPEAAVLPLSLVTKPSVGVITSVYLSCSTAGYFIARSTSRRAAPAPRSTVAGKLGSPGERGSPPALPACPRSPCFASPLMARPLSDLSASAPPSAVTAALTRSAGLSLAKACIGAVPTRSAADTPNRYFIDVLPCPVMAGTIMRCLATGKTKAQAGDAPAPHRDHDKLKVRRPAAQVRCCTAQCGNLSAARRLLFVRQSDGDPDEHSSENDDACGSNLARGRRSLG